MSLINDALKRASQVEKDRQREASPSAPLRPAQIKAGSGAGISWVTGVVVALLLSAAAWFVSSFFFHGAHAVHGPVVGPGPGPVEPQVAKPIVASTPVPVAQAPAPAIHAPPPMPVPVTPVPITPAVAPVAAPAPLAPFPDLKLQGIYYSRTTPKIAVADDIYSESDMIGEMRVEKIYPARVTISWKGQTNDFTLNH